MIVDDRHQRHAGVARRAARLLPVGPRQDGPAHRRRVRAAVRDSAGQSRPHGADRRSTAPARRSRGRRCRPPTNDSRCSWTGSSAIAARASRSRSRAASGRCRCARIRPIRNTSTVRPQQPSSVFVRRAARLATIGEQDARRKRRWHNDLRSRLSIYGSAIRAPQARRFLSPAEQGWRQAAASVATIDRFRRTRTFPRCAS